MNHTDTGFENAKLAGYTAEQVRTMPYNDIHILCERDKDKIYEDVFIWEAVREHIATALELWIVIETEDGTIIG